MPWGTFTPPHIATLFLSIAVPVLLFTTGQIRFDFRTIPITVALTLAYFFLIWAVTRIAAPKTEDELATVK